MMDMLTFLSEHSFTFIVVSALFGLVIGSFLNVVIHRFPKMMQNDWECQCSDLLGIKASAKEKYNLAFPGSCCPQCATPIRWFQNIPVLSFIFLRGRCQQCSTAIPWRYPVVEFLSSALVAGIAYRYGVSWAMIGSSIFIFGLIALSFIDFDTKLLPDDFTLPLLWFGISMSFFDVFCNLHDSVFGAIFGYMSLWAVYQLFRLVTGKEGMGYGDFKLLAALGAWLGWQMLPFIVVCSAVLGLIVGVVSGLRRPADGPVVIPFGPYLSVAALIALWHGNEINEYYLSHVLGNIL